MKMLFAGSTRAHLLRLRPLYERLRLVTGLEICLVANVRIEPMDGVTALSAERVRDMRFDVMFTAGDAPVVPRRVFCQVRICPDASSFDGSFATSGSGCDHYLLAGPRARRRFARTGWLPEGDPRAIAVGSPPTDRLVDGALERSRTLARFGFSGERPVVLYVPAEPASLSTESLGEVAAALSDPDRYDVLVKLEETSRDGGVDRGVLSRRHGRRLRLTRGPDTIPLLHAADVLVTDSSAAVGDFTLLDRPIVFLGKRGGHEGLRRAAYVPDGLRRLPEALEQALANPGEHSVWRRALARDLFYNPGTATAAALRWVEAAIFGGGRVAALGVAASIPGRANLMLDNGGRTH